ncbi:hypothetical protein LINGRAPRIM_LOCUS512 [Linum grandiflorum]
MSLRRQSRAANHGADSADLAELRRENAYVRRQVELLAQRINEVVHTRRRRHDDDFTVADDNSFVRHPYRSSKRANHRLEQGFEVEIPTFDGNLQPEEFIDWLSQVEEILDFKEVPEERRVSLVKICLHGSAQAWWKNLKQTRVRHDKEKISTWVKFRKHIRAAFLPYNFERELYQRFQNLRQGSRYVDEYTTDFYSYLARVDLNESPLQLVSRYIGGLRPQLQGALNMFDPLIVAEAQQRASEAEKQLAMCGADRLSQPANSTRVIFFSLQLARENSAQPTPQPARGAAPPRHGRIGGLQCFNDGEVRHRETDCGNLIFTNRGLFTEANESEFALL